MARQMPQKGDQPTHPHPGGGRPTKQWLDNLDNPSVPP